MEPRGKLRRQRKSKRATTPETYQHYIFEIHDWHPEYALSISQQKYERGPYWEHSVLKTTSTGIFPKDRAGLPTVISLVGERNFHQPQILEHQKEWKPNRVGTLEMRGDRREYHAHLPHDALWGLSAALSANRIRFILLYGPALKRGQTGITSMWFQGAVDLSEY